MAAIAPGRVIIPFLFKIATVERSDKALAAPILVLKGRRQEAGGRRQEAMIVKRQ